MTSGSEPKISVQYRTREGRAYEFTSERSVVVLSISDDGDPARGVWHAQAKSLREQGSSPVDGWGSSPAAAFEQVAGAWNLQTNPVCAFDWEAAGHELRRVRGI